MGMPRPRRVLDVGCGEGQALEWFRDADADGIGIEGLTVNARKCRSPVLIHDFTMGPVLFAGIDLVWCCEVAEHIEARYVDNLLSALCCGSVLAMTAAPPGQGGFHHVNEQPREYWINRIESRGMTYRDELTKEARELSPDPGNYFRKNGMIFTR